MKKDIDEIKEKLELFMKKYNVTIEVNTISEGRNMFGEIVAPKVMMIIRD